MVIKLLSNGRSHRSRGAPRTAGSPVFDVPEEDEEELDKTGSIPNPPWMQLESSSTTFLVKISGIPTHLHES